MNLNNMKKIFYKVIGFALLLPSSVFAATTGGTTDETVTGGKVDGGDVINIPDPLGSSGGLTGLINRLINEAIAFAGIIAVAMIVYAGYLFVVGGTNENNIKKARAIILYVVIGIAVLVLSKSIVYVVCNALGANCSSK